MYFALVKIFPSLRYYNIYIFNLAASPLPHRISCNGEATSTYETSSGL